MENTSCECTTNNELSNYEIQELYTNRKIQIEK